MLDAQEELKNEFVKSTMKTRKLGTLFKSLQQLEIHISKLNKEKNDLSTENMGYAVDLESIHCRLQKKHSELDNLSKSKSELEKTNNSLTIEVDAIKKEIEKLKKDNSSLRETVESIDNFEYEQGMFTDRELFYECD